MVNSQFIRGKQTVNVNKPNAYLFVDGSNLYAGQYELFGPTEYLHFAKIIKLIEQVLHKRFTKIFFYASYSPKSKKISQKEKLYLKNEFLFYQSAKSIRKLTFFKGYRSKTSGKEKEVDVKLAVDIVNFTHLNLFDELFLWSGDADFMHALNIAAEHKKSISILALENRIPNRFAYKFNTYVSVLKKYHNKTHPKQKIIYLKIDKNRVVETI